MPSYEYVCVHVYWLICVRVRAIVGACVHVFYPSDKLCFIYAFLTVFHQCNPNGVQLSLCTNRLEVLSGSTEYEGKYSSSTVGYMHLPGLGYLKYNLRSLAASIEAFSARKCLCWFGGGILIKNTKKVFCLWTLEQMVSVSWLFFFSKIIELADTVSSWKSFSLSFLHFSYQSLPTLTEHLDRRALS